MSPLEAAIQLFTDDITVYAPGTSAAPPPGTLGYYRLRGLVIARAYLIRAQTLGIENDVGACERLYRAGTMHFGTAAVPPEAAIPVEVLSPADQAKVADALATGNLGVVP